jgi:hypothetical protein
MVPRHATRRFRRCGEHARHPRHWAHRHGLLRGAGTPTTWSSSGPLIAAQAEGFQISGQSARAVAAADPSLPDHGSGGPWTSHRLDTTDVSTMDLAWRTRGLPPARPDRYRSTEVIVRAISRRALVLVDQAAKHIDPSHRAFHSGRRVDERQPTAWVGRVGRLQISGSGAAEPRWGEQ